jgi:hypothetical protein
MALVAHPICATHRPKWCATNSLFSTSKERYVAANEAIAKTRLLEVEAKTKALEAEAKERLLEAEARTKLLEADAKTKLLETEAMLMAEETKIRLTNLDSISDPVRREWFEKRQKMIWKCKA